MGNAPEQRYGVPAKQIHELAGHTSLAVTERYVHPFRGSKEGAIKALETFDGRGDIMETPDRASRNPLENATLQRAGKGIEFNTR